MSKGLKGALIGVGALVLTTLAIEASDVLRGAGGTLSGLVSESDQLCGSGAVPLQLGSGTLCVDQFEASPGELCQHQNPNSPIQTGENVTQSECVPVSVSGVYPWRFVSQNEAQQLCARAGKRLPNNAEWHRIGLTLTRQDGCVVSAEEAQKTGVAQCTTEAGVHDLVGNVWEWIDATAQNGMYEGRVLPESGFVKVVDNNGVVVETSNDPESVLGDDFAWTNSEGVYGMIRGGYYSGETDAGLYAQNLSVPFDLRTAGVGFRCVKNL